MSAQKRGKGLPRARATRTAPPFLRAAGFLAALALLVAATLWRASYATRLDGFTIDEPLHVAAAVAGARLGDFRLNPEHPPLVKLWVGRFLPGDAFELPPLRAMNDKPDERRYADQAVYAANDPAKVQARVRRAMLALNGLLLALFGLAAAAVTGPLAALGAVAVLAADPTVAAHAPVAMTDLPVALLSAVAVLTAWRGLVPGRFGGGLLAGLALGAALGTKHSALVTAIAVAGVALVACLVPAEASRPRRLAVATLAALVAYTTLWGLYGFRDAESREGSEVFNRPLAAKIADVASPGMRGALQLSSRTHVLPRAYLWGLADVTRAGLEGRGYLLYSFGSAHPTTPWWFFPGTILVKVPLGLLALVLAGALFLARTRPPDLLRGLALVGLVALLFLAVLARSGSGYAGVRHALPVFPLLALLGGAALAAAPSGRARAAAAVLFLLGLGEGLRPARAWEFYNLAAGGPDGAYRSFNDEGIDLGQRDRELVRYVHERLDPAGEVPYVDYPLSPSLVGREGLRTRSFRNTLDGSGAPSDEVSGTFLMPATALAPSPWYDWAALREAGPSERLGNLLVFRGTFKVPWLSARWALARAMGLLYGAHRDPAAAEPLLRKAYQLHPQAFPAALELGNILLERDQRALAHEAYRNAFRHAPAGSPAAEALKERLAALARPGREPLPPLRNPWVE